jgi:hypothetical protein
MVSSEQQSFDALLFWRDVGRCAGDMQPFVGHQAVSLSVSICYVRSMQYAVAQGFDPNVRNVSVAAGQMTKKPTFGQIASPTAGNQSTAVVAWSDVERPFWPKFGWSTHVS